MERRRAHSIYLVTPDSYYFRVLIKPQSLSTMEEYPIANLPSTISYIMLTKQDIV